MRILKIAATVIVLGVCAEAQAGCHAKDFDTNRTLALLPEVGAAAANLKALQDTPGLRSDESGLLGVSGQLTDRSAAETALFIGYIVIYERLTDSQDRASTDEFIAKAAISSALAMKSYADYLTVVAGAVPRFSAEIRSARDAVRKLETLFACVHSGSPQ